MQHQQKNTQSEMKKITSDIEKIQTRIIEADDSRLIRMYE
jgi:hypothetical protein